MGAGQPDFVVINLKDLNDKFEPGQEVTLEALKEKKLVRATGRRAKLPLKVSALAKQANCSSSSASDGVWLGSMQVLGTGQLKAGLSIRAAAFSKSAKEKIAAAGGKAEEIPAKAKWTKLAHKKMVRSHGAACRALLPWRCQQRLVLVGAFVHAG